MLDGVEWPVTFTSRKFTAAEKNYSQLEKEGLAVVFGVKKFHNRSLCQTFLSIESDHQPLSHLLNESWLTPPWASSRIQGWALTLSAYRHSIKYKAGANISNADALSRLPRPKWLYTNDQLPGDLVHLVNHLYTTAINTSNIRAWTDKDPILSQVKHGWPENNFEPYKSQNMN